jgi:DNA topoisomerase VI subunit B
MFGITTKGDARAWVQKNVVETNLPWDDACKLFIDNFAHNGEKIKALIKLLTLKQEKKQGSQFLRELSVLAGKAEIPLENPMLKRTIVYHRVNRNTAREMPRIEGISAFFTKTDSSISFFNL